MRVEGHGLSIAAPPGWEARISRRPDAGPILHVATFALHGTDGDFGAAATGRMAADDAFAALIEYVAGDEVRPGIGLFAATGWRPRLHAAEFSPAQLQVTRPGQLGRQRFFTHGGRPFCLYVVVMPVRTRPERLVATMSAVLSTVRITG